MNWGPRSSMAPDTGTRYRIHIRATDFDAVVVTTAYQQKRFKLNSPHRNGAYWIDVESMGWVDRKPKGCVFISIPYSNSQVSANNQANMQIQIGKGKTELVPVRAGVELVLEGYAG